MDINLNLQLGPFQFPLALGAIFIGLAISTYLVERKLDRNKWVDEKWFDLLITLVFVFVLIYKFGWAIFSIKKIIANPSLLLWTTGSTGSVLFGLFAIVMILSYKMWRDRERALDILDFSLITIIITFFVFNLLFIDYGKTTNSFIGIRIDEQSIFTYHPVSWYKVFWLGFLLILRFRIWSKVESFKISVLYFLLGAGMLLITIFDTPINLLLGITLEQWIWLLIVLTGSIGLINLRR